MPSSVPCQGKQYEHSTLEPAALHVMVPFQDAGREAAAVPDQAAAVAQQAEQAGAAKAAYVQLSAEDSLVEHYLRAALPSKVQTADVGDPQPRLGWRVTLTVMLRQDHCC